MNCIEQTRLCMKVLQKLSRHAVLLVHRFSTTLLGSRALVGTLLQPHNLLLQQGSDGLSVQQVLEQNGFNPTEEAVAAVAMKSSRVCNQHTSPSPPPPPPAPLPSLKGVPLPL